MAWHFFGEKCLFHFHHSWHLMGKFVTTKSAQKAHTELTAHFTTAQRSWTLLLRLFVITHSQMHSQSLSDSQNCGRVVERKIGHQSSLISTEVFFSLFCSVYMKFCCAARYFARSARLGGFEISFPVSILFEYNFSWMTEIRTNGQHSYYGNLLCLVVVVVST